MTAPRYELFHRLTDAESAKVRRWLSERQAVEHVRFRNIHYPEVWADFAARGGNQTPALWDGERLHIGADACIEALAAVWARDAK